MDGAPSRRLQTEAPPGFPGRFSHRDAAQLGLGRWGELTEIAIVRHADKITQVKVDCYLFAYRIGNSYARWD
jgi:hypothetical protein